MQEHSSHDTTSASLLVRVRDPADERSWREFENRYAELIRRYCRRRGLPSADIDDVSQMVWSDLAKGLRSFAYDPNRGRFRAYLGRIVKCAIARHFARYGPRGRSLGSDMVAMSENGNGAADEYWEKEWVDHHYRLAMSTLEQSYEPRSLAIFRRLIAGEPAHRVASDFGMSVGAINQAKHRIRSRMREIIAGQIREEDEPEANGNS